MQVKFESNLTHQSEAIDSVVRIFEGIPLSGNGIGQQALETFASNPAIMDMETIKTNVALVAEENGVSDYAPSDKLDFTIEMETGTGKTYVYLRTIYQLHKATSGQFRKFIIVVPTVAIREGVLATLRDTKQHFRGIYATTASSFAYNSNRPAEVRSFCATSELSIMVITTSAFNSANKIFNDTERDAGALKDIVRATRPIIIMDEPQVGMGTDNLEKWLTELTPLFKLRYSATHTVPINVLYRLTPADAYQQGLVKKIAVLSIHESGTQSNVAIQLEKVNLRGMSKPTATLNLNCRLRGGEIKYKSVSVKQGDNLATKTNNPIYLGWVVENVSVSLSARQPSVSFTNGTILRDTESHGFDRHGIFRLQIRHALRNHFEHKKILATEGIKPLALFFIDRVDNYVLPDGIIRQLFTEEYSAVYQELFSHPPTGSIDAVHNGYFAKLGKDGFTDDENKMKGEKAKEVYNLILRDKFALLDAANPLEFIFSHSALGVGWDNPNVFTICTLNHTQSQVKKRQEIGRGLRLPLMASGERYRDPEGTIAEKLLNVLTVVPNESYESFLDTYQMELREEFGDDARVAAHITDKRKPAKEAKRNDERFDSKAFRQLWEKIAPCTDFHIHLREEELVAKMIATINEKVNYNDSYAAVIQKNLITAVSSDHHEEVYMGSGTEKLRGAAASTHHIVEYLAEQSGLATRTIASVLRGLDDPRKKLVWKNPLAFAAQATKCLRAMIDEELVRVVHYTRSERRLSKDDIFHNIISRVGGATLTDQRGLYNYIFHESTNEDAIASYLDNNTRVRLFLKLPLEYKIPTPVGNYTPDFAVVVEKKSLDASDKRPHYFIIETKGTDMLSKLRPDERAKIQCAIKHFEALGLEQYYLDAINSSETLNMRARTEQGETIFD